MNGEDFKRLEQIIVNFKDEMKADNISFKEEIKTEFRHQLGIQSEHFQHKLDIVVEGHELLRKEIRDTREELCEKINLVDFKVSVLNEKIDGVDASLSQRIDGLETSLSQKIDAVAENLSAHRRDTEAHPTIYKIKEDN
jgi:hypothetical protein